MGEQRQVASYSHPAFEILSAISTVFAVLALFDPLGIWAITGGFLLFEAFWLWSPHSAAARADVRRIWKFFTSGAISNISQFFSAAFTLIICLPLYRFRRWYMFLLPLLVLTVGWSSVLAGWVHTTIGRKNYLDSFATIDAHEAALVQDKYPALSNDPSQEARLNIWKRWMGGGAEPVGPLYEIDTPEFTDSYRDLTATYSIGTTYRIQNAIAFLQSVDKHYKHDQTYRPTYRQIPACILNGGYSLDIEVERPSMGEKLVLYLQVTHRDPKEPVTATD
ncbi:MAG: hypothetical protein KF708_04060, partial [Pirellulales bacterium]|nr:hypothetical protein [Pirellulales bacterium]